MSKSKKSKVYIQGPIHRVELRLVTYSYLQRYAAKHLDVKPGELINGCYLYDDNVIYIAKNLEKQQLLHTLQHEIYHMLCDQMKGLDEEQRADAYATWSLNYYKIIDVIQLIGKL